MTMFQTILIQLCLMIGDWCL